MDDTPKTLPMGLGDGWNDLLDHMARVAPRDCRRGNHDWVEKHDHLGQILMRVCRWCMAGAPRL